MIKICKVENLKGSEILARQIITSSYQILMEAGDVIRDRQIERLKEFGIEEVYIVDNDESLEEQVQIIKNETTNELKQSIKSILETHTFGNNETLKDLIHTAEIIINEVMDNKNVSEQLFDIKERSADIYLHAINTCSLSILVALKLELLKEKVLDTAIGALIHDIGLKYLPHSFYNKELMEYPADEIELYKNHPIEGYTAVIEEAQFPELSKEIVLYHHERIDGSGFPEKSKKSSIELEIVQTCDAFDELICGIGCRRVKVYEAVEFLKTYKNQKFNGKVVDCLLDFTAVYPVGTLVYTNEGEVSVVIRQNREFPDRPVIKILKDKNGNLKDGNFIKDLLHEKTVFIEQALSSVIQ